MLEDLRRLVEPATMGDPLRPLLWVSKSREKLAVALRALNHVINANTVAKMLVTLGYSRQVMGKQGKREFVQVLRLMEVFAIEDVTAGVRDAIDRGVIGFDAVKHLLLCRIEQRPPRLDLTVYPYLPRANVATTSAQTYMGLLSGVAS